MVECEFLPATLPGDRECVLIDTWWNVNYYLFIELFERRNVLIDTWWNVN